MKKHLSTIIIVLVIFAGLSLLLYPSVSNYVNSLDHRRVIEQYDEQVEQIDTEQYKELLDAAIKYNERLADSDSSLTVLANEDRQEYESLLDVTGTGIMGYVEIPSVKIYLPIYHGTDDLVLQKGVGHLVGSSLPVGGESAHSILSGHRGLPSSRLFTDIDKLRVGDIFTVKVLNESFTYQVDRIETILPTELSSLKIEHGQDYCTLMTCTPYGVNTHRLLVRGHRVATPVDDVGISLAQTKARIIDTRIVMLIVSAAVLLIYIVGALIYYRKKR